MMLLLWWALQVFFLLLVARLFIDLALSFNRGWRPKGVMLPVVEIVMTVTDPPLKFLRRFIPPIKLGAISFDLAWTLLVFGILFLQSLLR
jgi:YggT family protein